VESLLAVQRLRLKARRVEAAQAGGAAGVASLSRRSASPAVRLAALARGHAQATYASRDRVVSLPAGTAPTERLAAAEAALDALIGAAAPSPAAAVP